MTSSTHTDGELAALLAASGVERSVAEVRELALGAAAAPVGFAPEAWLDLIAPPQATELRDLLRRLKAEAAARCPSEPPIPERLARLRAVLTEQGVDGLILPLTDEHRSEYLPASAQRLAWLTGFTGSAGLLIVLAERAAVFVDGRYTLQAAAELDAELFERRHVVEEPPAKWLAEHLKPGQRLGFDPRLHTKSEVERYRRGCVNAGADLVALPSNPVDAIWTTRPPAPIAPVAVLDDRYAGEASAAKRARMAGELSKAGAEVLVLTATDSIAWLMNLRGGDVPFNPLVLAFALLHADGGVELFLDLRKLAPGQNLGNEVSLQPIAAFEATLDRLGEERRAVLLDPSVTSQGVLARLEAAGARVIEGDDPTILAKACKNLVELAGARDAQRRDGAAVCRFLCWLEGELGRRGVSELEAAAQLEAERRRDPLYRGPSFETISAAGPHAALPHYRVSETSDRALQPGPVYLVDSGGQYLDATTDITRTIAIGEPGDEIRRCFTLVLKGHIAIARAIFPVGTSGAQLDSFARRALWQAGLDFDHGTGHGIGSYLCVHEGPQRIAKTGTVALKPGMIVSNEPGYYRSGAFGIRIENLVAVEPRPAPAGGERELLGFETLTRAPIDRRLVLAELLDPDERAWLDDYHALVRADLIDLLEGQAAQWLLEATAPI
ncbi:MAG TPA: aminopeptidase P family protein [Geminicoccaceae bacterium]|nr:aminopeptidase P family protein [Geminicoccaceae bacterium]